MKRAAAMRPVRRAHPSARLRDQHGLSTLEYALLFLVIIVGALALWRKLGTSLATNVGAGQHALSQTLDSALAANRDPDSSGPELTAPGPAPNPTSSAASVVHARATSPSSAAAASSAPTTAAAHSGTTGLLEQAKDYLVNTSAAQYALGIGAGVLQGYTPGGFLVPSPYASSKPFELGRGLGQMGAGIAETVAGLGMVGGGAAATGVGAVASVTPASPAGVGLVAVGVPVTAAGVAVVANGVSATLSGYGTLINAMLMSDSTPPSTGSSGAANGGAPPGTTSANAARGAGTAIGFAEDAVGSAFAGMRSGGGHVRG